MRDMRIVLKNTPKGFKFLEDVTKVAFFGAKEATKKAARIYLQREISPERELTLRGGYVGDNQMFLIWEQTDGEYQNWYVCDLPKEYRGRKIESFSL